MFEDDLLSSQPPSPPGSPSSLPQIYKTPQTMLGDQCQLSPHGLRFATYMSSFTKKNFPRILNHIERNLIEELTRQLRLDASFGTEYISPFANEHQMLCALEYDPGNINFWVKDVHSKNGEKSTFLSLAKLFDYFFETPTLISKYSYSNWRNTCVNKHNCPAELYLMYTKEIGDERVSFSRIIVHAFKTFRTPPRQTKKNKKG
jgi:hypothetical protein